MKPFENQQDAKKSRARGMGEWAIIIAGYAAATLLILPQTRPDFLKAEPEAEEAAAPAASVPKKPRPSGTLRVLYEATPPMHADDVAKLERAKQYMEMKYGLDNPVEIGIQPQPSAVCRPRADAAEIARCERGYRVKITLVRGPAQEK